ncbi:MAG: hypothetical protein GY870_07185 [archaeon]|nr:hypothetical protein [archaeon]
MSNYDIMHGEIEKIVTETFTENHSILGISISSHGGKNIFTSFKENFELSQNELAAASTSLMFLASSLFEKILNQEVIYTFSKGEKYILLCNVAKNITGTAVFDRKLVELEGFTESKTKMQELFLKVSAIVETSEIIKEDLFVQIRRTIPNSLSIALINKEGLPIRVQSSMDAPKMAAHIYALFQLTNILLKKNVEHTVIEGEYGSIIIQQVDDERILGIAVPESDDSKLNKYIAKIQEIIRDL